jgi:hypothetical protein
MTCTIVTLIGDSMRGSIGVTGQSSNGEWGQLTLVPAPAATNHRWALAAVACPTPLGCVAVGDDVSGTYDMNESFTPRAFSWQPSGTPPRPIAPAHLEVIGGVNVLVAWQAPVHGTPAVRYKVWAVNGRVLRSATYVTTATHFTFTRLSARSTYQVVVQAIGEDGQGSTPTTSASIQTTIGRPGRVVLSSVAPGRGTITATWQAPFYDGGSPVSGYVLWIVGGGTHELVSVAAPTQSRVIGGLRKGESYTVRVAAVNGAGRGPFSRTLAARVS